MAKKTLPLDRKGDEFAKISRPKNSMKLKNIHHDTTIIRTVLDSRFTRPKPPINQGGDVEKRRTLTFFFSWIWLTPHLSNIVCFRVPMFFLNVFLVIWVYFSWFMSWSLPPTSPSMCMGITGSDEFCEIHCYLQYHCRDLCRYGLGVYLNNIMSINLLLNTIDGRFCTATGTLKCPSTPHSPKCFRSTIFAFRQSNSSRIRPLVFKLHHDAATPCYRLPSSSKIPFP